MGNTAMADKIVRLDKDVHREAKAKAALAGKTLKQYLADLVREDDSGKEENENEK